MINYEDLPHRRSIVLVPLAIVFTSMHKTEYCLKHFEGKKKRLESEKIKKEKEEGREGESTKH